MRKVVDYDGYNEAEILEMYENGDVRTNVFQIEEEETIKSDTNIVFPAGVIQFTEDEIAELRPTQEEVL